MWIGLEPSGLSNSAFIFAFFVFCFGGGSGSLRVVGSGYSGFRALLAFV